ncbi:MAG TPA: transglutaminase-like domain-containing protein [Polyangiales bacterium]|nr:transglutaminase-like domain-containing protein [Polyangiales bacterium]
MKEPNWLIFTLRALVYGLCAAVFVWPLASLATAIAAGVGAASGALLGLWLAQGRVRSLWIVLGAAAGALLIEGVLRLVARSDSLADALSPTGFLTLIDALRFGALALPAATALSALSARHRTLAFVEVGLGGMMVSQLVAEHRHGAINRPFEIADPILAVGGDPSVVFYVLGMIAVVLLALVLIMERHIGRLIAHLAVVALLVVLAGFGAEQGVLPRPEPQGGGLGLTGKPEGKHQPDSHGTGRGKERRDNDNLEFRDQEQNKEKQTPVAVVLLHDDYSPPTGIYYFRQGAFSQFNGRRLIGTTRDGLDRDVSAGFPVDALKVPNAPQAGAERATLESTVALLADHTRPFGLESPVEFQAAQNPNPERFRRVYRVVSSALTGDFMTMIGHNGGDPTWSAEDRAEYLALPSDPRYGELARKIVEDTLQPEVRNDPIIKAWSISDWLGKEGTYSLKSKHAAASDPTGDFLFGDKVGYCVHFAHAATYLMRSVGVPARVATGYAVEESARQGGSAILVSSGAAHAWPEVYLDGVGWVIVDVQPQRTLDPAPEPPDADLQRLLGQLARGVRPLPPDGSPPGTPWKEWLRDFGRWAGTQVGRALVLAFVLMYLIKLWRFIAPQLAASARLTYRAELDRLAELGISRKRGESREAFADRVRMKSFERLTQLHVGVRFGSQRALSSGRPELGALASDARSERAAAFKWWRRALGALVPWSFFKAR